MSTVNVTFTKLLDELILLITSILFSLPSQRMSRRCDPLLRKQSGSYFDALEKQEDDVMNSSLQASFY